MISIVDTPAGLRALEPAWRALWQRAGAPAFLSPDWLLPWWDCFGTGQPRIALCHDAQGLAALAPFYILDEPPERKLLPLGVGVTDYFDMLGPPGTAPGLMAALATRARADGVTSWTVAELPPGAALARTGSPPGWSATPPQQTACPVLRIGNPIPAGTLRNIRQSRHRADRSGGWRAYTAPAADTPALWQHLLSFHGARWTTQGVLADERVRDFHARAIPRLAAAGTLQFHVLEVAGQISALYYTLTEPGRLLFYLSGFDAAAAYVSPGTVLLSHIIGNAGANHWTELHFLRGQEPYKYAWGAADRMNTTRLLRPLAPS